MPLAGAQPIELDSLSPRDFDQFCPFTAATIATVPIQDAHVLGCPFDFPTLLANGMPRQTNSTEPILPNEIWEQVLSHLEKSEVQRLRSVSSLFLNFALDAKYHNLTFFQRYDPRYDPKLYDSWLFCRLMKRTLDLRRPEISRRIRSLRLEAMHTYPWMSQPANDRRSVWDRFSTALRASRYRHFGPNFLSISQDLLVGLNNLHTLCISTSPQREEPFLSLVSVIWKHQFQTLGPEAMTLRTLKVNYFAGNGLQDIIQAPYSLQKRMRYREALGKLERLDFRLTKLSQQQSAEEIRMLTSFLGLFTATYPVNPSPTSHSRFMSNLTTLSIRLCCGDPPSIPVKVIDDIFGSLSARKTQPPFPNLSHLSIVVTNTRECPSTIPEFIALQRHIITHLRTSSNISHALPRATDIILSPTEPLSKEGWEVPPAMTQLAHLEIASTRAGYTRFEHASTLWSYLVQASPTLIDDGSKGIRTMIIDPTLVISYDELYMFCYAQPPRSVGQASPTRNSDIAWMPIFKDALDLIQHLTLKLFVLSPAHLNIILNNLPNLRSLHISIFARPEQFPFRPSSPIEAGSHEYCNQSPACVSVPREQEERDRFYPTFLEELDRLKQQKTDGGYTKDEELEELRVCLNGAVTKELTNALKGAYPGVKRVVVGNGVWVDHGFFDATW